MSKRQCFITISLFLTVGLIATSLVETDFTALAAFLLAFFVTLMTFMALRHEINGIEFATLLPLAFFLSLGYGLIFYFFPNFNLFFKALVYLSFFGTFYSSLLASNIFSAAGQKNLLLLKPAQTTLIFLVLIIFFISSTHLYKWGVFFVWQGVATFFLALYLSFVVFWAQALNKALDLSFKELRHLSLTAALILSFISINLMFLPFEPFFRSLISASILNAILGILILKINRQLKPKIIFEYCLIPLSAFIFSLILG